MHKALGNRAEALRVYEDCCRLLASELGVEPSADTEVNVTPGQFSNEDWVQVTGTIYPLGREVIVDASDVVEVSRPGHPYLTP